MMIILNKRQVEELAKLFLDVGKLTIGSLVLGFFQSNIDIRLSLAYSLVGLTFSMGLFIMGLSLLKEAKL